MQRVFFGSSGLRAGWSVLVFAVMVYLLVQGFALLLNPWIHMSRDGVLPPRSGFLMELGSIAAVVIATALMAMLERRPVLSYGYQGRARALRFVSGLAWGFVAISVLVLSLDRLGYLVLDGRALGGRAALHDALAWASVFLLVGFFEESLLRGYLQFTLTRGMGFWWGALLLSFAFGFGHGHNPGESPVGLFAAGTIGLVFCLSLWYTGSLWWAVGFHAAWDWGESYFYGTADSGLVAQGHLLREHATGSPLWSGGATGPEGSVLVFPLLALMVALMVVWWGKRGEKPFAGRGWRGR